MTPTPAWTVALDAVMDARAFRARIRRQGRPATPAEEEEADRLEERAQQAVVNAWELSALAQAVGRYGPECQMAQRIARDRARRLGRPLPFPRTNPEPDGPAGATGRAA